MLKNDINLKYLLAFPMYNLQIPSPLDEYHTQEGFKNEGQYDNLKLVHLHHQVSWAPYNRWRREG
jgi:hypothetical protein